MTDHKRSDVIVVTREAVDFGQGAHPVTVFHDAKHHVDKDTSTLHIQSNIEGRGNIAAFHATEWRSVISGVDVEIRPVTLENVGAADATDVRVNP